ncbi:membrane-associated protein, putative [Bodo saltans]|uniref:Membrane-associated protein, putative n=1 Tax=Bodo saltans TaxID=75058 RepID=A0A0S4J8Q7_BODSA|nr:membrane-associated protein, putative [Bodo saltans]|eukprot:CUG85778.1 membrane-associated protein, putative [Bodo saltans]
MWQITFLFPLLDGGTKLNLFTFFLKWSWNRKKEEPHKCPNAMLQYPQSIVSRHAGLTVASLVTAVLAVCCSAHNVVEAREAIYAPCGKDTNYGPNVSLGATFIIEHCDNSPNGTRVTINLNKASAALLGLSFVIQHSRRVLVLLTSTDPRSSNLSNVLVWIQNVTNDMDNTSTLVNASVFRIADMSFVSDVNITVVDVLHTRDTAFLRVNYVDSIHRLRVHISSVFFSSTYAVMAFDTVTTFIQSSSITLINVSKNFRAGLTSIDSLVNLDSVVAREVNISLLQCRMLGSLPVSRQAAGVRIRGGSRVEHHSVIFISELRAEVEQQASFVSAMQTLSSNLSDVAVRIVNFSSPLTTVSTIVFHAQNAAVQDSFVTVRDVHIMNSANLSLILAFSQTNVIRSKLHAERTSLANAQFSPLLVALVSMEPLGSSVDSTVTIFECNITSSQSSVIYFVAVSVTNTQVAVRSVFAFSQGLPVILSSFPSPARNLSLVVADSYLAGVNPFRFERMQLIGCSIFVVSSSLHATASATFPITFALAQLIRSTVAVVDSEVIGGPSGDVVALLSVTLQHTTVTLDFTALNNCGGIIYASTCFLRNSTLRTKVTNNIEVPQNFPNTLLQLENVNLTTRSTVALWLPARVSWTTSGRSPSNSPAFLFVQVVATVESSIVISGLSNSRPSSLSWPTSSVRITSSNISSNCNITFQSLNINTAIATAAVGSTIIQLAPDQRASLRLVIAKCVFSTEGAVGVSELAFIGVLLPPVANCCTGSVVLTVYQSTFSTTYWSVSDSPSRYFMRVIPSTSDVQRSSQQPFAVLIAADQMFLFGVASFLSVHQNVSNNHPSAVMASVTLRCSWWGRHQFTSPLSPIQTALGGRLVRSAQLLISPVTSDANKSVCPSPGNYNIEYESKTVTTSIQSKSHTDTVGPLPAIIGFDATTPSIQIAAFIAAAGAVTASGSAGDAAIVATLSMMTCAGKASWESNTGIQRLVVSVFYDLGPAASVIGNLALVVFAFGMQWGMVVSCANRHSLLASIIRFPSASWTLFLFLLPGVMFSAVFTLGSEDDMLVGGSAVFFGSATIVVACGVTGGLLYFACVSVWPRCFVSSTSDILCEPHLPWWFMRLFGPWLLPQVMWEPNELKLRYGDFFSSVASTDALWIHSLLQIHGALFSLIAAIPFPQSLCVAQFVLAIVWMCVPIGLMIWRKLQLLRRPPNNSLMLFGNVVVIAVLVVSAILAEGPTSSHDDAATSRDVLGFVLSVIGAMKTTSNLLSAFAEGYAKRRYDAALVARRHVSKRRKKLVDINDSPRNVDLWLESQHVSISDQESTLMLLNNPKLMTPKRALSLASLDAHITLLLRQALCTPYTEADLVEEPARQVRERAQNFALKLLVVRAARGALVAER